MELKGGFSFCGVDINDLELTYVPEMSNVYAPMGAADFNVSSLTDGTMDGGFFYGTTLKPKEFILRCIFEDRDIRKGILVKAENLFRRGRTGRLVFKQHDWVWYTATVTDQLDTSKLTNRMNGFITIRMTAYYPYGRSQCLYFNNDPNDERALKRNEYNEKRTGFLNKSRMISNESPWDSETGTIPWDENGEIKYLYYNPGTEFARTALKIAGNMTDGITIVNETTGQKCDVAGVETRTQLLIVDGLNGKVALCDPGTLEASPAFLYHHGGFIDLASYGDIERDVRLNKTDARKYVSSQKEFNELYIGKWIIADNTAMKIIGVDGGVLITDRETSSETGSYIICDIVDCVNEITVKKHGNAALTRFGIEYRPTFR